MRIKRYTGDEEKTILTALIVSTPVLAKVLSGLQSEQEPFRSKWSNLVFGWCRDFYLKYDKAPRSSVEGLFRSYAEKQKDDASVGLIERFLSDLSEDYKGKAQEINQDYLIDIASRYFNEVRYSRLRDNLEEQLDEKDMDAATKTVAEFYPIQFATSDTIDVFTDEQAWLECIETTEEESLIQYPGDLGEFFGPFLARDSFVAFLAPEKRGKSFWLLDLAWRAVKAKRRTFLFSVGDMSRRQMLRRLAVRAARRPLDAGEVVWPKRLGKLEDGTPRLKTARESYTKPISRKELLKAQKEVQLLCASSTSMLKLQCTSNSTTTVEDIEIRLDEEEKDGWTADVVVIDYADILAPETGSKGQDFRHQTNETWKALRRLSQDRHCLVVTATQSDAASYDSRVITRKNFSEDKRKIAHVTGMAGINQTEEEKQKGLYRLNWVALREGAYYESKCVTVAGSLALANPAMKSIW